MMEAGTQYDDLDQRSRKRMNETDELQQEQREINLKKRLNQRFLNFVQQIEAVSKTDVNPISFDIPYKELAFFGNTGRSFVKIMPTVNCLVNLTEFPFFVVTIDEIEYVHFERVMLSLKNFDMIIIFRDFQTNKKIGSIDSSSLETLKQCIDYFGILFSEGQATLNWNNIKGAHPTDFKSFLDTGAWSFLRDTEIDESEEERLEKEEDSDFDMEKDGEDDEEECSEEGSFCDESSEVKTDQGEGDDDFDDEDDDARALQVRKDKLKRQMLRQKYEQAMNKHKRR